MLPDMGDDDADNLRDLLRRALAAYFRAGGIDQPSKASHVTRRKALWYVVLKGGRQAGPLAVYRVKQDGALRRLRRWPKDFDKA